MLIALILAAAAQAASPAPQTRSPVTVGIMAAPSDVSAKTRAVIAPVLDAIAAERAAQAKLPPPKDDAEKLIRMGRLDQAPRLALGKVDFSKIPAAERKNAQAAIWQQIIPIDEANQAALLAMLPEEGWFLRSRYGEEASQAAFHIIQHGNQELWRRFVPVLEPLAAKGEVKGGDFARMFDRLAVSEKRPQRYGTQFRCEAGKWVPHPLEDEAKVEELRAKVGLFTYAENLAAIAKMPPC